MYISRLHMCNQHHDTMTRFSLHTTYLPKKLCHNGLFSMDNWDSFAPNILPSALVTSNLSSSSVVCRRQNRVETVNRTAKTDLRCETLLQTKYHVLDTAAQPLSPSLFHALVFEHNRYMHVHVLQQFSNLEESYSTWESGILWKAEHHLQDKLSQGMTSIFEKKMLVELHVFLKLSH